tara:strand:+ start:479 stop:724 length:246 start_codon:yes stop_codon:yes gene_type:complete
MRTEWETFNAAFEAGATQIVPVDTEDRDIHLAALARMLNVDLVTDWEPVEHKDRKVPPAMDLTDIYALPVVQHYYRGSSDG